MTKLRECPFCDSTEMEIEEAYYDGPNWTVYCKKCGGQSPHNVTDQRGYDTTEEAITAWNTRPELDRMVKRLEKLWDEIENATLKACRPDCKYQDCFGCHLFSGLDEQQEG